MENASKALIIAGAILLAILIISLGIIIFSQAESVINSNAMSELEMQQFNTKFTQFEGSAVRGATVRSMMETVLTSNLAQDDTSRQIEIILTNGNKTLLAKNDTGITTANKNEIKTGATYKVQCERGNSGSSKGLVNKINITKNESTTRWRRLIKHY